MKQYFSIFYMVCLLAFSLSCGKIEEITSGSPAEATVSIGGKLDGYSSGSLNNSLFDKITEFFLTRAYAAPNLRYILAVPVNGEDFSVVKKVEIGNEGKFTLNLNKKYNYLLVIEENGVLTDYISIAAGSGNKLILLPVSNIKGTAFDLGTITPGGVSSITLDALIAQTSLTDAELQQMALLSDVYKNIVIQFQNMDTNNPGQSISANIRHNLKGVYADIKSSNLPTELFSYLVSVSCSRGYEFGDEFDDIYNVKSCLMLYPTTGSATFKYLGPNGETLTFDSTHKMLTGPSSPVIQYNNYKGFFTLTGGIFVSEHIDNLNIEFCSLAYGNGILPENWTMELWKKASPSATPEKTLTRLFNIPNTLPKVNNKVVVFLPELRITTDNDNKIQHVNIQWKQSNGTDYINAAPEAMAAFIDEYEVKIYNNYNNSYKEFKDIRFGGSETLIDINCTDVNAVFNSADPVTGAQSFMVFYKMGGQEYFFSWNR